MRNLLEQLIAHKAVPPAVRYSVRKAIAARDWAKSAQLGQSIMKMLLARGELVKVGFRGTTSDNPNLYAFRDHSTVMDLNPLFADFPEIERNDQPKKSDRVPQTISSEIKTDEIISGEGPVLAQEELLSAMESAQRLQTEDIRSGGEVTLLEELLEMLERYLPGQYLFMELYLPEDPYHDGLRVFKLQDKERPYWTGSRLQGESVWIDSVPEIPEFICEHFASPQSGDDGRDAKLSDIVACVAVPLRAPLKSDAFEEAPVEAGLLYIVSCVETSRETMLRTAQRLSGFVTSSWRQKQRMHSLVHTDALTGIRNRSFFDNQIKLELERARRSDSRFVLVLGDIDHFKLINDTYGHPIGDLALQAVARELLNALRRIDIVCRIGGEEFALILPDTGLDNARDVVSRLQARIAGIRIPVPDLSETVNVTISFGGVFYPECGSTSEELYRKADKMLYLSKERGRNRCHFWNPDGEPFLSLPADDRDIPDFDKTLS